MPEEKVEKMAKLLLAGGKMLSIHCNLCKSPLFEFEGKVVCPVCGEKPKAQEAPKPPSATAELEAVLEEKLGELASKLKAATDQKAIAETVELLGSILDVLKRLREK